MENPQNNKKSLEQEQSDLQKSISEAKESTEKATKRMEELLAVKKLSVGETASAIETTQPTTKNESPVEPTEDNFDGPALTPDEMRDYFSSRSDQKSYWVKAGLESPKNRREEIVNHRRILVSRYLNGEISAEDMLAEKPFGYERKKIANKDFVKKIVDEEVAYWGPRLQQTKIKEEVPTPNNANTESKHEIKKGVQEDNTKPAEAPIEISTKEKKEDVKERKDPIETEFIDLSKKPETVDAETDLDPKEENPKSEKHENKTAKNTENKEPKNETKKKSKEKTTIPKPTDTLELGQRIRDIRRSKAKGFLLKNLEQNSGQEKSTNAKEETEIKEEVKNMSEKERSKLENGLHNLGFRIEKKKNEYFVKTFEWIASKQNNQSGTITRFTKALAESYRKEVEMADKKAKAGKNASKLTKVSNVAYIAKNVLRPYRIFLDATGMSPAGIQKYIMTVGMLSSRLTGAAKEARLANEKVSEQYRINDVEEAVDRAWKIYEKAKQEAGSNGEVSRDDLENIYIKGIPGELQEKLKNPEATDNFFQGIVRKHLQWDMYRLNENILEIEEADDVTEKEKKQEANQLLRRWEKRLLDYDRIIYNSGTISGWAMAARYAESTSKNVVRLATLQTLYMSAEKIFHNLSGVVAKSQAGIEEIKEAVGRMRHSAENDSKYIANKLFQKQEILTQDTTNNLEPSEPIVTGGKAPEEITQTPDQDALIEQARQKVEEGIKLPKINMEVGTKEIYTHTEPVIKVPESSVSGAKLDQLHDVIKNEVNGDVIVTSRTPDGENVIFGTRNIRGGGVNPDSYVGRGNPDVIVTSKSPDGENVVFGSRNMRRFDLGEQIKSNMEAIRQNNAFIVHSLEKVFPQNTRGAWDAVKSIPAREILGTSEQNAETQNLTNLIDYIKKLEEVTGLEPKGRGLFNWRPESTEDFIKRAVEWARMNGQLGKIEIQ